MQFGAEQKDASVFRAARVHSVRVQVLKRALPVLAVIAGAAFSWFTFFTVPATPMKIDLDGAAVENGKLVMSNPKLDGFTGDKKQPYKMQAERALQNIASNGELIELENIDAELPVGDKLRATIKAKAGVYDNANDHLKLTDSFTVETSDGLFAALKSADINVASGQITTNEPVDIRNNNAHIVADRMTITDNGKIMVFEQGVRLVIDAVKPQEEKASASTLDES
ncbi:MAG: LPS export ABC transporter periplasmic protein LptC [Phyllobacterium sp.]